MVVGGMENKEINLKTVGNASEVKMYVKIEQEDPPSYVGNNEDASTEKENSAKNSPMH